jgi:hypothetical protein
MMNFYRVPKSGTGTFSDPIRPAVQPSNGSYLDLGIDMLVATEETLAAPATVITQQQAAALIASINPKPDAALGVAS